LSGLFHFYPKPGVSRSSKLRCKFHEYFLKVNENSIFIFHSDWNIFFKSMKHRYRFTPYLM
jgi:hypothetical protein